MNTGRFFTQGKGKGQPPSRTRLGSTGTPKSDIVTGNNTRPESSKRWRPGQFSVEKWSSADLAGRSATNHMDSLRPLPGRRMEAYSRTGVAARNAASRARADIFVD